MDNNYEQMLFIQKQIGVHEFNKKYIEEREMMFDNEYIYIFKGFDDKLYKLSRIDINGEVNSFAFVDMSSTHRYAFGVGKLSTMLRFTQDDLFVFDSFESFKNWLLT